MARQHAPAAAGLGCAVLSVFLVLVPYALPGLDATAVGAYYEYGLLGAWSVLVLAAVAVVVFASALQQRSDPATAAGAGLGLGVAATLLALAWVLALPYEVVAQLPTEQWFEYHRFAVLASAIGIALSGLWFAADLDLV